MASHEEEVLYALLSDVDSMDVLAREGLDLEAIPTEEMRPVVQWVIDSYYQSGRTKTPSNEMILARWADTLEANEISLGDGTEVDEIEWAIDALKARHAQFKSQQFLKAFGTEMATATSTEKLGVLAKHAADLTQLSLSLSSKIESADLLTGLTDALANYEARALTGSSVIGLSFDMPEIDDWMGGIRPGEICTFAAPPKFGKSYWAVMTAIKMARKGKRIVLFSQENSVQMTYERLACFECGIDPAKWQQGTCTPEEVDRVRRYIEVRVPLIMAEGMFMVEKMTPGESTPTNLYRRALMLGADQMVIDQLSHIDHPDPGRKGRPEIVRDIMQELHNLVGSPRGAMSLLLLHQINRTGVESARKVGYLAMDMLAESSEVERSSDFVLSGYQSQEQRQFRRALIQMLATRRTDYRHWQINWDLATPLVSVIGPVNPYE